MTTHVFDWKKTPLKGRFLIEASAGTGKTFSLIRFIVRLIMEGDAPIKINEILANYREDLAFRPPQSDHDAVTQLREIRRLRKIIRSEIRAGPRVDTVSCQKEDRRLLLLVLKVNISNLMQRVLELRRLQQVGSCKQLIEKGLEVIKSAGIHDEWLDEKAQSLMQIQKDIDAEVRQRGEKEREKIQEAEEAKNGDAPTKSDLDEIFGDKKKW